MRESIRQLVRKTGVDLVRYSPSALPPDFPPSLVETVRAVEAYTMTSPERIEALVGAVNWIERAGIPGAVVECGVWRGGSMMAAARTLLAAGNTSRELFLYDTYAGMTAPEEVDRDVAGRPAEAARAEQAPETESMADWCNASIDEVRRNVATVGYPAIRTHYIAGTVEETIPATLPGQIALLRLDTDWYASTKHELEHLYPLVAPGGVVIIDDYGAWEGARRAVDEFLADQPPLHLFRIDVTGRMFFKP